MPTTSSPDDGAERKKDPPGAAKDGGASILSFGDSGERVADLQLRLHRLGYWLGPRDEIFGRLTRQAVIAFQGAEGLARDGVVGDRTRTKLEGAAAPSARDAHGDHIEIDESRGLLMVVRNGAAVWIFHTSTGTEAPYEHPSGEIYLADTPNGEWTFTWEVDGWRDGRLGMMWRPKYFHEDGIAIHGYPTVPPYPASHGCARVTTEAMDFIWDRRLAPLGSRVIVYGAG